MKRLYPQVLASCLGAVALFAATHTSATIAADSKKGGQHIARSQLAFRKAVDESDQRIAYFKKILSEGGDEASKRAAALNIMTDPMAVRRLNVSGDIETIQAAANSIKSTQEKAKQKIKAHLKKDLKEKYGDDLLEIRFDEFTHKSHVPKLGQDWDVTPKVRYLLRDKNGQVIGEAIKDVPLKTATEAVNTGFYEAAKGIKAPTDPVELKAFRKKAARFAHRHSVVAINARHAEAFNEVEHVLAGGMPRDAQQLSLVLEHKALLPRNEAAQIIDKARGKIRAIIEKKGLAGADAQAIWDSPKAQSILARAEKQAARFHAEYARTYLKLYDKHILPRVAASGGKLPESITRTRKLYQQLADGELDWVSFQRGIRATANTSDASLVRKTMGMAEAVGKLGPGKRGLTQLLSEGGGKVLGIVPVVGEFARGYNEEFDQRILDDRDMDLSANLDVAGRVVDNTLVEPARMIGDMMDKGFNSGMKWLYDKHQEKGYWGALGDGSAALLSLAASGMNAASQSSKKFTSEQLQGAGDYFRAMTDDPLGELGRTGKTTWDGFLNVSDHVGQFLGVDAIPKALFGYGVESKTLELIQFSDYAQLIRSNMDKQLGKAEKTLEQLKALIRQGGNKDGKNQAHVSILAQRYIAAYRQASHIGLTWQYALRRQFGGSESAIEDRERDLFLPLFKRWRALPRQLSLLFAQPEYRQGLVTLVKRDKQHKKQPRSGVWGRLEVQVLDAANGQPIGAAKIKLDGGDKQASGSSNANGLSVIDKLPIDSWLLKVSAPGYKTAWRYSLTFHPPPKPKTRHVISLTLHLVKAEKESPPAVDTRPSKEPASPQGPQLRVLEQKASCGLSEAWVPFKGGHYHGASTVWQAPGAGNVRVTFIYGNGKQSRARYATDEMGYRGFSSLHWSSPAGIVKKGHLRGGMLYSQSQGKVTLHKQAQTSGHFFVNQAGPVTLTVYPESVESHQYKGKWVEGWYKSTHNHYLGGHCEVRLKFVGKAPG